MKGLRHTLLELEWEYSSRNCDFCSNHYGKDNKGVNEIITRREINNKLIAVNIVCEICKEKFENDELPKCERCERLQTKLDRNIFNNKNTCECEEEEQEKELPTLPHQRESMAVFYERQINGLQEEKNQLTEEVDTHLEALEISEVWNKRQKQELLDRIKELEEEVKQLKEKNSQIQQVVAQVEVKSNKKSFLPFGRKT